ncbi:hypothetical protein TSAR_016269 [Trichomalopsis sarcophagae]|uniref:Protein PET117 homolog, mitochondrial n=1 Tax=Trichomalopsis sarcophagae TaxID=543379 RepID=A0A232F5Y2_9HYME|nr:hypothetical protein TSAR_016269 [Trichomalopsis sarcophagae]
MSTTSKLILGVCIGLSGGIIMYVHLKQDSDIEKLHMGVMKDLERQRRRKIENIYLLQQQSELTREFQRDIADKTKDGNAMPS